jgi:hypothetical protein
MKNIIIFFCLFLQGCFWAPKVYTTKIYEKGNVLYVEQQGSGAIEANKDEKGNWKQVKTDYKSTPLFVDITKLYAVKKMAEDD